MDPPRDVAIPQDAAATGGDAQAREVSAHSRPFETVRPWLPHLAVFAVLCLLLCGYFWRLTIGGEVLSPADWIYTVSPWVADQPQGYSGPGNVNQGDDAFLYYPRRAAVFEGDTGTSWWQDDYLAGARNTFSNDFLGLPFYPPAWAYEVMPFDVANGVVHLSVLLVAGIGMYLLLTQLRLPPIAAAYGGMLFMFTGHFIVWLGAVSLPAIVGLVPLLIYGFERYREKREPVYLLIPALCLAGQIYLGYVPAWVVTGIVLCIYGAVRLGPSLWRRSAREVTQHAAAYGGAAVVGVLLAAYALVPSVASALSSEYQGDREFGLQDISLENAWTYLFPNYWGDSDEPGGLFLARDGDYPNLIAYFGITAVPLAVLGLWRTWGTWVFWFVAAVLVFSVSQIYGIEPLKSLAHLPGLRQTHNMRWNFGVALSVAILAPFGMAALLEGIPRWRTRLSLAFAVGALLAVAGAAVLSLALFREDAVTWRLITEGRGVIIGPANLADAADDAFTHFHRQVGLLALAGALTIAGLLIAQKNIAYGAVCGIFALTFVDLFAFGSTYNASLDREDVYPTTPGIEYLQQDTGVHRIAPVGSWLDPLPGYTSNLFGFDIITGYDHYRDEDYQDFLRPMQSPADEGNYAGPAYVTIGSDRWPLNENLLALLNVKYIATPPYGLFYGVTGQSRSEVALGVYGRVTQGQTFETGGEQIDAVEFLLGTGVDRLPDVPVTFRLLEGPRDRTPLHTWRVDAESIPDNQWLVLDVPADVDTSGEDILYIEISAQELTAERPLYVWASVDSQLEDGERFESRRAAAGTLAFRALQSPGVWVRPMFEGEDMHVYELRSPLPRAWGVGRTEVLASDDDVLQRIAEDSFDPAKTVAFAEEDLSVEPSGGGNTASFETEMLDYETDSLTVRTEFSGDGYLVVSNRHDGGWEATVDGDDAEIVRANGILQAVPVEAGTHTVELSFRPSEYVWGQRISIASAIALLMAIGGYTRATAGARPAAHDA